MNEVFAELKNLIEKYIGNEDIDTWAQEDRERFLEIGAIMRKTNQVVQLVATQPA